MAEDLSLGGEGVLGPFDEVGEETRQRHERAQPQRNHHALLLLSRPGNLPNDPHASEHLGIHSNRHRGGLRRDGPQQGQRAPGDESGCEPEDRVRLPEALFREDREDDGRDDKKALKARESADERNRHEVPRNREGEDPEQVLADFTH